MNIYAAIFLIPFTVVLYTSTGGLKVGAHFFVNGNSFFEGLYGSACVWPCQMLCPSTTETHKANWLSWFSLHSPDFLFTESFLRFY